MPVDNELYCSLWLAWCPDFLMKARLMFPPWYTDMYSLTFSSLRLSGLYWMNEMFFFHCITRAQPISTLYSDTYCSQSLNNHLLCINHWERLKNWLFCGVMDGLIDVRSVKSLKQDVIVGLGTERYHLDRRTKGRTIWKRRGVISLIVKRQVTIIQREITV